MNVLRTRILFMACLVVGTQSIYVMASGASSKYPAKDEIAKANDPARAFGTVQTTVRVDAGRIVDDDTEGFERRITPAEIESSAGTFGDPSRFMQLLPGVVSDNDERNDFLVRGGNPDENLFVIDNIEVPSINQLVIRYNGWVCIDD